MQKILRLSVHELVDFLLRKGDIDNRVYNKTAMQEGTYLHSLYQASKSDDYISEYPLLETFVIDDFKVTLEGRADGISYSGEFPTIEEIKSTVIDLEAFFSEQKEWHLGQAKCYALMYAHEKNLTKIRIRLVYIHQLDRKLKLRKTYTYKVKDLEQEIDNYIKSYLDFYKLIFNRIEVRNISAKNLEFPFPSFRDGQRKLSKFVYGVASKGGMLFCEAPTGIGKTMSTLYPSIRSFSFGENDKIFYLTAKTSGKEAASNAMNILLNKGLKASYIVLTAKDKICPYPKGNCNPDDCPLTKGYYSKLQQAISKAIEEENVFDRDTILRLASKNMMCPFEFSLDLSLFIDVIICDYNYFFDPFVHLKRYFDEDSSKSLVLVDEAHNLVERSRKMYSASLSYHQFLKAKKGMNRIDHSKMRSSIKKMENLFSSYKVFLETQIITLIPKNLANNLDQYFVAAMDVSRKFNKEINDDFLDFALEVNRFSRLLDYYNSNFLLYVSYENHDICFHLQCLDASTFLADSFKKVKGKIIFSATLSPSKYYIRMLGGDSDTALLKLPSPFAKEHLHLMVAPKISVRYKDRDNTYLKVAELIKEVVSGKVGNYFVYVPSYDYLVKLIPHLMGIDGELLVQEKEMSDLEKELFLLRFKAHPNKSVIGVAVVGGAFGEGIDLVSDRLIGAIIIGVGIPTVGFEREQLRHHYDENEEKGYVYSYINPGINKIMQAVGRVIRSEDDYGVALLIDDRYLNKTYSDLFSYHYRGYHVVYSKEDIKKELKKFWGDL